MLRDFGRRSSELAIDLGTTCTRVATAERGLVLELPSVVAVDTRSASPKVVAVGEEAREMLGRTPDHIHANRPVQGTRFDDYGLVQELLDHAIRTAMHGRVPNRPRMVLTVAHGRPDVARRALQDSARAIGAGDVVLVPKGVASSIGSGLPVEDAVGNLLIDIGGGSTEIILMSLGGLIDHELVDIGGQQMDAAIQQQVSDDHGVTIGLRTAESIKLRLSRAPHQTDPGVVVTGRDNQTGIPREVRIDAGALADTVLPSLDPVVQGLQRLLSRASAELSSDVADNGVVLSGGTALFPRLVPMLRDATGLPVVICENPRHSTIQGATALLRAPESLQRLAWR